MNWTLNIVWNHTSIFLALIFNKSKLESRKICKNDIFAILRKLHLSYIFLRQKKLLKENTTTSITVKLLKFLLLVIGTWTSVECLVCGYSKPTIPLLQLFGLGSQSSDWILLQWRNDCSALQKRHCVLSYSFDIWPFCAIAHCHCRGIDCLANFAKKYLFSFCLCIDNTTLFF